MTTSDRSSHETALFCRYIESSIDSLLRNLEGLNEEQLNWHPQAPNTNSLYALAVHTMGNAEESLLFTLCGQPGQRNREQEFLARGISANDLVIYWQELRQRIQSALQNLSPEDLERKIVHPRRGTVTGREILIIVARHAGEHMGQAELTRDLLLARS
jgi:uncharacterized damage-inducible protein DinB